MTKRICLWSGPRNVSTALMYSFGQRSDTKIVDEPLYAHYLRVSGAEHPGRDRVLAAQENDGEKVIRDVILGPSNRLVLFIKNMAHHFVDLSWDFLGEIQNVILTRHPTLVLPSLDRKFPNPSLADTAYVVQVEIVEHLESLGASVPVVDAQELLSNPAVVLSKLCEALDIGFEQAMLHWPSGPRPEDGVWADIWYADVHKTTGFAPYRQRVTPFPDRLKPLLHECVPYYERLHERSIKAAG